MVVFNVWAIWCASMSEGLYLPFSRQSMVSLLTPTCLARSSCVRSYLALSSLILVLNCMVSRLFFRKSSAV